MKHRGHTPRRASVRELRLLVLGVVLVITAIALATCETLSDRVSALPAFDAGSTCTTSGGGLG